MEHFSILNSTTPATPALVPVTMPDEKVITSHKSGITLRFPGEDGGRSLAELAQHDLEATLQLLAERAQYITGASGAAIALNSGEEMICRASAGPSAPEVGTQLQTESGLTGESVRTRQILRCDDAGTDHRVNQESCRALNIVSVVVMPLVREGKITGVFELLSSRPYAFEERDLAALQRLGDMIQTAIDQAEAAKKTAQIIAAPVQDVPKEVEPVSVTPSKAAVATPQREIVEGSDALLQQTSLSEATSVGMEQPVSSLNVNMPKCKACDFPVSEGRSLCVDCETSMQNGMRSSAFLSQYSETHDRGWLRSNIYLIGTALMGVLTIVLVLWLR
jgi:putative methionine-R-sulfoxide reductase with GAF domain